MTSAARLHVDCAHCGHTTVVELGGIASRVLISTVTGYSKNTRNLYLQELARRGYVLPTGSDFAISDTGRAALGPYEKLPTGDKLRLYWIEKLPEGLSRVLACITDARSPITRAAVSQITGYSKNTRNLYIQDLVRRRLVEKAGSDVRASAALFDR